MAWYFLPAFKNGLSTRPPPATIPTTARHRELTTSENGLNQRSVLIRRAEHRLTFRSGRKSDSGLAVVTVADNSGVVSGCSGQSSPVSNLLLDVADNGTLWALSDGENVSDVEGGLLSAVDEGSGGDTLSSDEGLLSELVPVWVSEDNSGEGGTSETDISA